MKTRRQFIQSASAVCAAALANPSSAVGPLNTRLKLGFDNFSIRALGWKANDLLDYAAKQKVDALLISDLDALEPLDTAALKEVGQKARDLGIELHVGTLSLCPSSVRFDKKRGTAEEHAKLLARVARDVGSPVARCVLGFGEDRKSEGGIRARMKDMAAVLRNVKSYALEMGVKFAIENHAGDMQGWELADLIADAGSDFVGATYDSGNATWTLEDPEACFQALDKHVLTSGIRDSMIWETPEGARVAWTAMGEGCVDFTRLFKRWAEAAPEVPVILEIISGFNKPFNWRNEDFWPPYREIRAAEFSRWQALAAKGREIPPFKPAEGQDKKQAEKDYQLAELERSLSHCREKLNLGRK